MKATLLLLAAIALVATLSQAAVLRLDDGRPFVGAYFFDRWWEPWCSDAGVVERDMLTLKRMGVDVLFYDHEPIQAWDGDWAWLDRAHKLARRCGLEILPWLEVKCGADLSVHRNYALEHLGLEIPLSCDQEGKPRNALIWDKTYQEALFRYCCTYIDRYKDTGALLRIKDEKGVHLAVAPSVEVGWDDAGFDEATTRRFRKWLLAKYGDVNAINRAWGTHYASVEAIDPRDKRLFPYPKDDKSPIPQTTKDHAHFRADLVNAAMEAVSERLRAHYPGILIVAEIPYPPGWIHPHAVAYRYAAASFPETVKYADIVVVRTAGPWSVNVQGLKEFTDRGQKLVLAHRIGQGGLEARLRDQTRLDAAVEQALKYANGIGMYSWNEMGDCPLVGSADPEGFIDTYQRLFLEFRRLADRRGW